MAITQLNTADFNYEMMLNVINKSYKGKADITLSEYDTTAAPDVKVGSVFEDNGAIFIVDTSDITPTGYSGISNSTTFYLYYDEDPGAIIYSSTAPTWNDALQGWYNSNDRAFFTMFKDLDGTLYQSKIKMSNNGDINKRTKIIEIGDWNMQSTTSVNVVHGLALETIRHTEASIRVNGGTWFRPLDYYSAALLGGFLETNILHAQLTRISGGIYDDALYNSTSFNRGWVTIQYEG